MACSTAKFLELLSSRCNFSMIEWRDNNNNCQQFWRFHLCGLVCASQVLLCCNVASHFLASKSTHGNITNLNQRHLIVLGVCWSFVTKFSLQDQSLVIFLPTYRRLKALHLMDWTHSCCKVLEPCWVTDISNITWGLTQWVIQLNIRNTAQQKSV